AVCAGDVRLVLERAPVEVTMASKPCNRAALHRRDDRLEVGEGRRRRRVKQHGTARVARESTVEHEDVKVNVEIEAAEPLHKGAEPHAPSLIPSRLARER